MRLTPNENIPENECWELLRSKSVGRVALSIAALPAIVPVGYSVDGPELTINLDAHEAIPETALHDAIVAFEVDTIDSVTHSGWIVHVTGSAHMAEHTTDISEGAVRRTVRLAPAVITGQRVHVDGHS
jgi:nitroimidazol reductase NimA-like FMN-containing flavoprotein (pyridoxamine 5'-phosphate oxidase superfamily)